MLVIDASVLTHPGKIRTNNEDSVTLIRPGSAETLSPRGILALVADGMGGHESGELASRLAAEEIARSFYSSDAPPRDALEEAFRSANREIFDAATENPALKGMGTTCVAVAIYDDKAWWAWIRYRARCHSLLAQHRVLSGYSLHSARQRQGH